MMKPLEDLISYRIFEDQQEIWASMGIHSPVLQGSVPVSRIKSYCVDKLNGLMSHKCTQEILLSKSFLYRRLCQFDQSLFYAKMAATSSGTLEWDCKLNLCVAYFYAGLSIQAELLIKQLVGIGEPENLIALLFWRAKVCGSDFLCEDHELLCCAIRGIPEIVYQLAKSPVASKRTIDMTIAWTKEILECGQLTTRHLALYIHAANRSGFLDKELVSSSVQRLSQERITNDYNLLQLLCTTLGLNETLRLVTKENKVTLTSELLALIFYNHTVKQTSFKADSIVRIIDISNAISRPEALMCLDYVLSDPFVIKDRNTSDGATRFYSLDYASRPSFAHISEIFTRLLDDYYKRDLLPALIDGGIDLSSVREASNDGFIWYDASYSYGGSSIQQHLHAAYPGCMYLATCVWYAQVPNMAPGCGELVLDLGGLKKSIRPSTNQAVFFPPWVFHGTTPTQVNSQLRLTFNFDRGFPTVTADPRTLIRGYK